MNNGLTLEQEFEFQKVAQQVDRCSREQTIELLTNIRRQIAVKARVLGVISLGRSLESQLELPLEAQFQLATADRGLEALGDDEVREELLSAVRAFMLQDSALKEAVRNAPALGLD